MGHIFLRTDHELFFRKESCRKQNLVKGKSTDSSYRGERSNDKINVCRIGKQEV